MIEMFDYSEILPSPGNVIAGVLAIGLGVGVFVAMAQEGIDLKRAPDTMTVFDSPFDGTLWLEYRMAGSIHHIRGSAIAAIVWTKGKTERNTVYFAGGTLQNNITLDQYMAEIDRFNSTKGAR